MTTVGSGFGVDTSSMTLEQLVQQVGMANKHQIPIIIFLAAAYVTARFKM